VGLGPSPRAQLEVQRDSTTRSIQSVPPVLLLSIVLQSNQNTSEISDLARSPFDKIQIAALFGIRKEWVLEGYVEICKRKEALTLAEAKLIMGNEMTDESLFFLLRVIQARELVRPLVNPSLIQSTVAQELGIPVPVSNNY
jgi:hypothetical protein